MMLVPGGSGCRVVGFRAQAGQGCLSFTRPCKLMIIEPSEVMVMVAVVVALVEEAAEGGGGKEQQEEVEVDRTRVFGELWSR